MKVTATRKARKWIRVRGREITPTLSSAFTLTVARLVALELGTQRLVALKLGTQRLDALKLGTVKLKS